MTVAALLAELRAHDIHVRADGDQLHVNAPPGGLTLVLREQLRLRKAEILEYLRGPAELSFSQQRLWFLDKVDPGGAAYVIPVALEICGSLNVQVLERGLGTLMSRHESLRTQFVNVEGRPLQVVSDSGAWRLPVVDLSAEADGREQLEELLREEAARGFDLEHAPLFRARLYRLAADIHVLLLAMHHIISDGWSIGILIRELGELYHSFTRGEPATLPALKLQYRDFARWQRDWLQGDVLERLLAHWRSRVAGAPQVLDLPTDRPRPRVESHHGAVYSFTLPLELTDALRRLARREGATLFMTLLSGFALLLSRYSGQQDLLVGTPVANRSGGEIENVVGCFVNTLVLRADLSGDPSVRQFLARLREVCLDDFEHQDLPFDRLVEELRPARDLSRNPLFQVMFALQNTPTGPLELPGLTLRPVDVARGAAHVDLSLHVQETVEGLSGIFEYATDLFEESTIARMAAHWRALLEAMTATPERCVWDLPLLTDGDRRQLLVEWNETKGDYPAGELMHELFEAQAARTPEAIAVVHEQRELSYGELNARANQLAHYLRGVGVKPDARVAICVERGIEMVVGLFAVLKAGGAYVPLDPAYPTERLTYMLQDSAPVAILTNAQVPSAVRAELRSALAGGGDAIPVIDLQAGAESWATQPASNPQRAGLKAGHLAYVIYTSGSTGRPKGVMIEHRNAVNFLYWAQASFSPAQLAHTLFSTSLNFDLAMYECFAPLVVGATTRVVRNALELAQAPHPVTLINTVPSTINALLDAGGVPETVRTVNLAGEPLKRALVERLFAQTQVDTVCNLYGPSETTTYSTWVAMRRADGFAAHIGRPIANTRIYLLDAHGQPVPVGAVGEIYIGGAGVARGYLNREELTAERFLPDPFAAEPDARMYRTGDLARYLTHGNIEFLGRNDFQVKIRGFRIELGEIETSIASHPAVRETVVIAREDMPGDQRLVAYVVPRNGEITAADLKQHLSSRLPSYMVPSDFVMLETLPRTPNAKIDRKALPAPGRSGSEATYTAPRNATEEAVAASWRKALQLQRVGIHDNFFEVGGHSLSFVRMISEINRSFKTRLGMVELIQNPTVEQLAKLIDAWHSQPSQLSRVVLLQEGRSELPVYFIYAGPGELRVAQHMAGSHPVFGVEARWPMAWRKAVSDNQTSAFPSLEQMVAPYVTELSAHARSTPCVLAGFCYAGRIAFEAAHQLRKLGGKVEFVILIDTDARPPNRYKLAWQIIRQDWKQSPSSVSTGAFQSLGSRVKNTWHTTWWLLGKVKTKLRSYFKRPKLDLGTLSGVLDEQGMPLPWGLLQRLYDEMEKTYVFRSLASRGVLFRTDEWDGKQIGHAPHDALGWETLFTEGVEIIPVAGHHFSIWGKQVPAIAHEINRVLAHRSSGQAHEAAVHDRKPLGVSPAPETGIGA